MITRKPVKSAAVKSVGFKNGVLEVEYANGGIYRMEGISQAQHDALHEEGASIGRGINTLKGHCSACTKVEPEKKD